MERLKRYEIVIEGIDKTGKDLLANYIFMLSKKRYVIHSRGLGSLIAYNRLYKRDYEYNISDEDFKTKVYVFLNVDKDDWLIRCKTTNEPEINYELNVEAFKYAKDKLSAYDECKLLVYNTSKHTPCYIAKAIVCYINKLNGVD